MHYYRSDLAYALRHRWSTASAALLPAPPALTQLISVAYQASLLSEEARPVVGQLGFASAATVETHTAGQSEQHVLVFSPPRPYAEQELRRLTATVQRAGNLLTIDEAADGRQPANLGAAGHPLRVGPGARNRRGGAGPPAGRAVAAPARAGPPRVLRRAGPRADLAARSGRWTQVRAVSRGLGPRPLRRGSEIRPTRGAAGPAHARARTR